VNQSTTQAQPDDKEHRRFRFIDGLRGLAALLVTGFHFYNAGPLHQALSTLFPLPIGLILEQGWLGVEVFFVISGFVIAYSLRETKITLNFLRSFTLRRFLRLSPPYWGSILLVILINYFSNWFLTDRAVPLPTVGVTLAHLFYLQNILGMGDLVPVFWTLCLEIQFYLVFVILLAISQNLIPQKSASFNMLTDFCFVGLAIGSIFLTIEAGSSIRSFFYPDWYTFFMGVLVCWTLQKKTLSIWLWLYVSIITISLIIHWDIRIFATLITGLSIYLFVQYEQLQNWLNSRWQQYVGKISYSLYLIHLLTGMRIINLGYRVTGDSPILALVWFILAIAMSILSAHLFYTWVEKPSLILSRKIKFENS
jgi:hypothetical protein